MFIDRRRDRPVHHLGWRLGLTSVGAVVALLGIFLDHRLLVWIAIAILLAAFGVRLLPGDRTESGDAGGDREDPR